MKCKQGVSGVLGLYVFSLQRLFEFLNLIRNEVLDAQASSQLRLWLALG